MSEVHKPSFLDCPGSKSIVVFIHGFMGSPRQFDRLADAVRNNGLNALILLLPGHGRTTKEFSSCTYRMWKDYVRSEIDKLSYEFDNIWLVGHSMGGLLALCAAVYPNPNVRGVFPIASPLELTFLSPEDIKVRLIQVFYKDGHHIKDEYLKKSSVPRSPDIFFRSLAPMVEVKKLMLFTEKNLTKIRIPVMAVYSISDELISIKSIKILKSGLTAASPFKYIVLTDSLHAYYTEEEKVIIESALIEFLTK